MIEERALIEPQEETGLTKDNINLIDRHFWAITEDMFTDGLHSITLYLRAEYLNGSPKIMEPDKCSEWRWYSWKQLPNNLFLPVRNLIKQGMTLSNK